MIKILLCSLGIRKKIFYVHKVRWLVKLLLKLTKVCLIKMLNRLEEIKPPCICVRLVFSDASIFKWDSIQNGSKKFMNSFLQFASKHRSKNSTILVAYKVKTFWEAHKNLHNLPHALDIYFVNVQTKRKIFSNFVCFSESPNFTKPRTTRILVVLD